MYETKKKKNQREPPYIAALGHSRYKGPQPWRSPSPGLGLRTPDLRGSIWQMNKHRMTALALVLLLLVVWRWTADLLHVWNESNSFLTGARRRRQWHPTPVLLPGKSHGWRSLVGCCRWGLEESDTTERLHFHFSLSCIGEGNGNPLQCSSLENPRDGGAWWAAVYRVAQSQTRLKRLSSSSMEYLIWY